MKFLNADIIQHFGGKNNKRYKYYSTIVKEEKHYLYKRITLY
jgi:hypothetical protein